jgi:hypothetical protein
VVCLEVRWSAFEEHDAPEVTPMAVLLDAEGRVVSGPVAGADAMLALAGAGSVTA